MGQRLEKAIGCGSTSGEGDRLWVNASTFGEGEVVGQRLEKAIGCGLWVNA